MTTETEQKTPPRGWLTMCICWIGIALSHFLLLGLGIMLPAMRDEMGFSSSQAGTLRAVGGFLTALFSIPLNVWIARFSTKSVVGLSIVGMSLAYLANGLAPNYLFLLFARGFGVLISMSLLGAIVLLQGQWFPPDQMGKMNGIRQGAVNTWQIVSMAVVPLLMANLESWRTIYYIMAAAMIPTAVAWFLLGQENRTPEYEASVTAQAEAGSPVGSALRRKEIILIGLGGMGAIYAIIRDKLTEIISIPKNIGTVNARDGITPRLILSMTGSRSRALPKSNVNAFLK